MSIDSTMLDAARGFIGVGAIRGTIQQRTELFEREFV